MTVRVLLLICISVAPILGAQELKLVHVIFAHKLFAPVTHTPKNGKTDFPKNLTYEYFNRRTLEMSNTAKLNMYDLGVYLRERYDTFLGDTYMTEVIKMRTTEFPLSMMSGQLVNAGLWPPRGIQIWDEDIEWQPIPSDYKPLRKDMLLMGALCPNFQSAVEKVLQTNNIRSRITYHKPLFKHISLHTGMNVSLPSDVALINSCLEMLMDQGIPLPLWADGIFPDGEMYNVTLLEYDILSETLFQKQLNGGPMLKEVLENSMSHIRGDLPRKRKMMLYSGDERNLVAIFKNLNLWSSPHIPAEASTLIFELHFNKETDVYGIKTIYYTGTDRETIPLTIPGCEEVCPIDKFKNIIFDLIPASEESLCGWTTINQDRHVSDKPTPINEDTKDSASFKGVNVLLLSILLILAQYAA